VFYVSYICTKIVGFNSTEKKCIALELGMLRRRDGEFFKNISRPLSSANLFRTKRPGGPDNGHGSYIELYLKLCRA